MEIGYELIRSGRKTVALEIRPDGKVVVRAPRRMPLPEIERFVRAHGPWLRRHLAALGPPAPKLTPEELGALTARAREVIPARAAYYAPLVGTDYGRITIRHQRTRWGSCSSAGNLNFNCLLLLAPPEVLDSVVVHELCHRHHPDHGPAFYAEVRRVFPDYDRCSGWLRRNGAQLLRRLP